MTFNFNFRPWEIILRWADGNASAEIEALKTQIAELRTMSNLARIQAALAVETAQAAAAKVQAVAEALAALQSSGGITDAAAEQVLAAVSGTIEDAAPAAAGRFNVSISKVTTGGTERRQTVLFDNEDISEEFKNALEGVWSDGIAASEAQPAGGGALTTILLKNVNGAVTMKTLTTKDQVNAFDANSLAALAALARAALPA